MSWFKVFSAVVVGVVVSGIVITLFGMMVWSAMIDYQIEALFGEDAPTIQLPPVPTPPIPAPSTQPMSSVLSRDQPQQNARRSVDPSVVRTNKQMCEFWQSEYSRDGLEQSRVYMESACTRWRETSRLLAR